MSRAHPIVAVTGASGAGTTSVQEAFKSICADAKFDAVFVEGDSFHRYEREEMRKLIDAWERTAGRTISHFGPEANLFGELETLFTEYGERGMGRARQYLHNEDAARLHGQKVGTFTEWSDITPDSDLLIYEGLHGGIVTDAVNISQHVDLLIGVTPTINLEWIQKLYRDQKDRGHSIDDVTTGIPSPNESLIVVRFNDPNQQEIEDIINAVGGSFQSKEDCIVVPGQTFEQTLKFILSPRVQKLVTNGREERNHK